MIIQPNERMVLEARAAEAQSLLKSDPDLKILLRDLYLKYVPDGTVYQADLTADRILRQQSLYRQTCNGLSQQGEDYIRAQLLELVSPMPFTQQCTKLYEVNSTLKAAEEWLRNAALESPDLRKDLLSDLRQDHSQFRQKLQAAENGRRFYSGRFTVEARDRLLEDAVKTLSASRLSQADMDALLSATSEVNALEELLLQDRFTAVLSLLVYTMVLEGEIENAPRGITLDQIIMGVSTAGTAAEIRRDLNAHQITVPMAESRLRILCEAAGVLLASALIVGGAAAIILLETESVLLASLIYCGALILGAAAYVAASDTLYNKLSQKNLTVQGHSVTTDTTESIVAGFRNAGVTPAPLTVAEENAVPTQPVVEPEEEVFL